MNTFIIGNGDVVVNRLLPSLEKAEIKPTICNVGLQEDTPFDLLSRKDIDTIWISTPSQMHYYYTDMLKDKANLLVVEKPITDSIDTLNKFEQLVNSPYRDKIFFLSYYILEKALPLTFLARPRSQYTNYITGYDSDNNSESTEILGQYFNAYHINLQSGIKSIDVRILEGEDKRPISDQLIETFLHNVLIASLFTELPEHWKVTKFIHRKSHIELLAHTKSKTNITLVLDKNKNNDPVRQSATIEFNNGAKIISDLRKKTSQFIIPDQKSLTVGPKSHLQGKYDIQVAMVNDVLKGNFKSKEIDGLFNQLEVLKWLFTIQH